MSNKIMKVEDEILEFSTTQLWNQGFDQLLPFRSTKVELIICGKTFSDDIVTGAYTIYGANVYYFTEVGVKDDWYLEFGEDAGVVYAFVTGVHHALSLGISNLEVVYEEFQLIESFKEGKLPMSLAENNLYEFARWLISLGIHVQYVKKEKGTYPPLQEMVKS